MPRQELIPFYRRLEFIELRGLLLTERFAELRARIYNRDKLGRFASTNSTGAVLPAGNKKTVDKPRESGIMELGNKGLKMSNKQFGEKVGKHAKDFGLDPSDENSRKIISDKIADIHDNFEIKIKGTWLGQGKLKPNSREHYNGEVDFFIKGNDVVVCKENKFVTILKDGAVNNKRVKEAIKKGGKQHE